MFSIKTIIVSAAVAALSLCGASQGSAAPAMAGSGAPGGGAAAAGPGASSDSPALQFVRDGRGGGDGPSGGGHNGGGINPQPGMRSIGPGFSQRSFGTGPSQPSMRRDYVPNFGGNIRSKPDHMIAPRFRQNSGNTWQRRDFGSRRMDASRFGWKRDFDGRKERHQHRRHRRYGAWGAPLLLAPYGYYGYDNWSYDECYLNCRNFYGRRYCRINWRDFCY